MKLLVSINIINFRRKEMRIKENLKQNKAITLVAMTITIIIILILTSIIIIQLRNNGIL